MAERIDLFRRALAGASRAIAKDPEVEVIFASDIAPASGKQPARDVFAYFVSTDKPNAPVNALGIQQRLNITASQG